MKFYQPRLLGNLLLITMSCFIYLDASSLEIAINFELFINSNVGDIYNKRTGSWLSFQNNDHDSKKKLAFFNPSDINGSYVDCEDFMAALSTIR